MRRKHQQTVRQAHLDPVIESRLQQLDLMRDRVRSKQGQITILRQKIVAAHDRARRTRWSTKEFLHLITSAQKEIAGLDQQIAELMQACEDGQREVEEIQARFLRETFGGPPADSA